MHETGRRRRLLPKPSIEDQSIASRRRKALAAVVLLSAAAATPARSGRPMRRRRVRRHSFNPNGTIRAAIQEPGLFAFYYPNLDVLNGGAPTPAARLSRDWPALRGACAAIGGGVTYCGER